MVLESQPMLSDIVTDQALGPWATVFWKVSELSCLCLLLGGSKRNKVTR